MHPLTSGKQTVSLQPALIYFYVECGSVRQQAKRHQDKYEKSNKGRLELLKVYVLPCIELVLPWCEWWVRTPKRQQPQGLK